VQAPSHLSYQRNCKSDHESLVWQKMVCSLQPFEFARQARLHLIQSDARITWRGYEIKVWEVLDIDQVPKTLDVNRTGQKSVFLC